MFLPISKDEFEGQLDFICVTGDAYVDHPSFGTAIISRTVEALGFTIGIIAQPKFSNNKDIMRLGKPKYAFLVNSGNIDSMVAHYTVAKRLRKEDAYSPGKKMGLRPDMAVVVYSKLIKSAYPDIPVIMGGIEASLRRFAHYDYWQDKVMPSVLYQSGADLLIYGMGELAITQIVTRLAKGEKISDLTNINGTCYLTDPINTPIGSVECPSFKLVSTDMISYAKATKKQYENHDEVRGRVLTQRHNDKMLVQNPPMRLLTKDELDYYYSLPYERTYHPIYEKDGGVPAIEEVEFSVARTRGCYGACNFCSIAFHQGRKVVCRSDESILNEVDLFLKNPNFKGYIHDVGGPTANFSNPSCKKQLEKGLCPDRKCLAPTPCKALQVDHTEYINLLRKLRAIKGIKKVFIRSGIRFDYMLADKDETFFNELVQHHVSGQLKVAPEHCSNTVLDLMGKPHIEVYKQFANKYYQKSKQIGKEQYLVPYLMSSHPGSTLNEAIELAVFLKNEHIRPEQVQDFYPTPGTISTCMYYTGINPMTLEKVYVAKTKEEKAMQRALLQYYKKENQDIIIKALTIAKRKDLIQTLTGVKPNAIQQKPKNIKKSPIRNKNNRGNKREK